jgi:hypothetical protein
MAAALAAEARGDDLCPAGRIAVDYDAGVRPELATDPWTLSYDGVDPETDVSAEDGILTVDATGFGAVFFGREEPIDGLAPAYRFEVRARTVGLPDLLCVFPGSCFLLGAHGLALAQDRVLNFEVWVADDPDTGLLIVHGKDDTHDLGPVDTSDFSVVEVEAIRDGPVTVSWDGEVRAEFLWSDLPTLDDLDPNPALLPLLEQASDETVVPVFGSVRIRTEWDRVRYEICRPETENVDVWVETQLPDDSDGRTLKGGTGETLEGLDRIVGTVERVDVVHRRAGDPEGEKVVTVLEGPEALAFYDAGDPDSLTRMTGLSIPPGELHQLRVVVSEMRIDLRGETHDVRLPSGGDTGLKVVPVGGPVHIPEDEAVTLVIAFDPYASLGRNRQGFWWDPVTVTGDVRPPIGPGRCGPLGDPCPPERVPDPAPDPCIGPDCPRDPIDPTPPGHPCAEEFELEWSPGTGFRCIPRCAEDEEWDADLESCLPVTDPLCPEFEQPPGHPVSLSPRPCDCDPGTGYQQLLLDLDSLAWLNRPSAAESGQRAGYNNNQMMSFDIYANTYVRSISIELDIFELRPTDSLSLISDTTDESSGERNVITLTGSDLEISNGSPQWVDFPDDGDDGWASRRRGYSLLFDSLAESILPVRRGFRISAARLQCRPEPREPSSPPELRAYNSVVGILTGGEDVLLFRFPDVGFTQSIIVSPLSFGEPREIEVFHRQGSSPTKDDLLAQSLDGMAMIRLEPGESDEDHFIAVRAAGSGRAGAFAIRRSIEHARRPARGQHRIGVDWRMSQIELRELEEYLQGSSVLYYFAFNGIASPPTYQVWNGDSLCGGRLFSACTIKLKRRVGGIWPRRAHWDPVRDMIIIEESDLNRVWLLPHEFGHSEHRLPDEYRVIAGGTYCGHSLMARSGPNRRLCTPFNHRRDAMHDPGVRLQQAMWSRAAAYELVSPFVEPLTFEALSRRDHSFGGAEWIERMNYRLP